MRRAKLVCVGMSVVFLGGRLGAAATQSPKIIEELPLQATIASEVIFIGTVKIIEPLPFECGEGISWQRLHYEVHELLKGQLDEKAKRDFVVNYECGVDAALQHHILHVGQRLLVFCIRTNYPGIPTMLESLDTTEATPERINNLRRELAVQLKDKH